MNDKIKILYIMDHFYSPTGGTEGQIYNLIKCLDKEIFQAELCIFREISSYFDNNPFPCKVFCINIESFYNPLAYLKLYQLRKYITLNSINIVQVLLNDASMSIPPLTIGLNTKVIITRRDMGFWYTPVKLALLRFYQGFSENYLVNSQAVKEKLIKAEKVHKDKIHVIYNSHDLERFNAQADPDFHEKYNIPKGSKIVGIVANFRPVKRVRDLIVAFAEAGEKLPDTYLVLIGHPGDHLDEYTELIKAAGIENIRLIGMVDNPVPYIKHFSVGVITSESEGLSNSLIEYMGCGIPVIATDIESNRELLGERGANFLYPVGNTHVLAMMLIDLLNGNSGLNEVCSIYQKTISEKFDIKTNISMYEDFYREINN